MATEAEEREAERAARCERGMDPRDAIEACVGMVGATLRGYPHPADVGRAVSMARGPVRDALRRLRSEDIRDVRVA